MIEQLIIDIENTSDLEVLIPILQERKLKFRSNEVQQISESEKALLRAGILEKIKSKSILNANSDIDMSKAEIIDKIKSGGMNIENFDAFMLDFEESRKDRPLPFRD